MTFPMRTTLRFICFIGLGLSEKNTVIGNGKTTLQRDALKEVIRSVGHETYSPMSSFISMNNRKTFLILDNPEDIKEIYPEEFL